MRGIAFRGVVRPGFGRWARRGAGRPLGVYQDHYDGAVFLWHWSCRLDCWALLTSGWYLPDRGQALDEGMEHLAAYHFPEGCADGWCTQRHVEWPIQGSEPPMTRRAHLAGWQPVTPLLREPVTLRA
jgi:hypothetical protein